MAIEIVTKEDLELFRIRLMEDFKKLLGSDKVDKNEWLRGGEVRKILKISPGTLQHFRITGLIHPSKVGGIFYYRLDEINGMLERGVRYNK